MSDVSPESSSPDSNPDWDPNPTAVIIVGWIGAFLMPIVGLVCGIILVRWSRAAHGTMMMIFSLFMAIAWLPYVTG